MSPKKSCDKNFATFSHLTCGASARLHARQAHSIVKGRMKKIQKNHEVGTLLRLIAPDSVEVELVPLAAIEKAEFVFFWATIFLTVWGTVLGTWLSLVTVEHDNQPVRNLLLAVLFFYRY